MDIQQITRFDQNLLTLWPHGWRQQLDTEMVRQTLSHRAQAMHVTFPVMSELLPVFRDQQLFTGLAMLLIAFIKACSITQYHFEIINDLVWLSSSVTLAADFVIRPQHFENRVSRHFRFAATMTMIASLFVLEIITWKDNYLASSDTMGLPMICCWSPHVEAEYSPYRLSIVALLFLVWNAFAELSMYYPKIEWIDRGFDYLLSIARLPGKLRQLIGNGREQQMAKLDGNKDLYSITMAGLITIMWLVSYGASLVTFVIVELLRSSAFDIMRLCAIIVWAIEDIVWWRGQAASLRDAHNNPVQQGDENDWGFGQMLPVMLLVLPALAFLEAIYDWRHGGDATETGVTAGIARSLSGLKGMTSSYRRLMLRDNVMQTLRSNKQADGNGNRDVLLTTRQETTFSTASETLALEKAVYSSRAGRIVLGCLVPGGLMSGLMYAAILGYTV